MNRRTRVGVPAVVLGACLAIASPLVAQAPNHTFLLTGFGASQYNANLSGPFVNGFSAKLSTILLYSMSSDFLFESEIEYELEDGATNIGLEYGQVDYQALEHTQIVAGKFLLPFGIFGERVHPTWINKLPDMPILFGHGEGGVPHNALLPVMSDVGAMVRWARPFGSGWALNFSGYVTQGPSIAEDEGDAMGGMAEGEESPAPTIAWGVAYTDNNNNKMVGGRLGLVKGPSFEGYLSAFHARYDPDQLLDVTGMALSAEWRRNGFQLRTEGVLLNQDFEDDAGAFQTLDRSGVYVEASRRFGPWEPVARWGHLADGTVNGEAVLNGRSAFTVGLDYWFAPMIPLKLAYVTADGMKDQFVIQWAFGF